MRMRTKNVKEYHLKKKVVRKDGEGGTYTEYGSLLSSPEKHGRQEERSRRRYTGRDSRTSTIFA